MRRRGARLLLGAAGAAVIALTAISGSLATAATHPAHLLTVPASDIVGTGLVNCKAATGEIGFSPATVRGTANAERVSIWFQATKCTSAAPGTRPVPKSVIGSISFDSSLGSNCPQLGTLGTGVLNLTYNYPGVPNPMIDPSVALSVTVNGAANWTMVGQVTKGSYPDPVGTNFTAKFHPIVIGAQNCTTGVTSMYIQSAQAPFFQNI